jgi:hypothetical protein
LFRRSIDTSPDKIRIMMVAQIVESGVTGFPSGSLFAMVSEMAKRKMAMKQVMVTQPNKYPIPLITNSFIVLLLVKMILESLFVVK